MEHANEYASRGPLLLSTKGLVISLQSTRRRADAYNMSTVLRKICLETIEAKTAPKKLRERLETLHSNAKTNALRRSQYRFAAKLWHTLLDEREPRGERENRDFWVVFTSNLQHSAEFFETIFDRGPAVLRDLPLMTIIFLYLFFVTRKTYLYELIRAENLEFTEESRNTFLFCADRHDEHSLCERISNVTIECMVDMMRANVTNWDGAFADRLVDLPLCSMEMLKCSQRLLLAFSDALPMYIFLRDIDRREFTGLYRFPKSTKMHIPSEATKRNCVETEEYQCASVPADNTFTNILNLFAKFYNNSSASFTTPPCKISSNPNCSAGNIMQRPRFDTCFHGLRITDSYVLPDGLTQRNSLPETAFCSWDIFEHLSAQHFTNKVSEDRQKKSKSHERNYFVLAGEVTRNVAQRCSSLLHSTALLSMILMDDCALFTRWIYDDLVSLES